SCADSWRHRTRARYSCRRPVSRNSRLAHLRRHFRNSKARHRQSTLEGVGLYRLIKASLTMKSLLSDTSPEAEDVLISLIQQAPVWKRLQMLDQMYEMLQSLTLADLRRAHPGASEDEIRRRLAARVLSRSDVIAAYGWDPEVEGF